MLPILYQNKDFILYSYPLLMGIGWGIAYQIYFSLFDPSYSRVRAQLIFWGLFFSAWIGSKLLFLMTFKESTEDLAASANFWMGGGFVFYGGFIAGVLFLFLFRQFDRRVTISLLWPMLPALAVGHGIGRIGCLLAGCCFGKPTDLFWGIFLHGHYRHPTQLLEAVALIGFGVYLMKARTDRKILLARYLIFYGLLRWVIEALRGDLVRGSWGIMTPSQWISLFLVFTGLALYSQIKAKP